MAAAPTRPFRSVFFLVALMGIVYVLILCPGITTNAAPVTRSGRLALRQDQQAVVLPEITNYREVKEETISMDGEEGAAIMVRRRTAVELDDYPGSGANNRHTPRQQFGRCVDC